jgi:hypothetical protein
VKSYIPATAISFALMLIVSSVAAFENIDKKQFRSFTPDSIELDDGAVLKGQAKTIFYMGIHHAVLHGVTADETQRSYFPRFQERDRHYAAYHLSVYASGYGLNWNRWAETNEKHVYSNITHLQRAALKGYDHCVLYTQTLSWKENGVQTAPIESRGVLCRDKENPLWIVIK